MTRCGGKVALPQNSRFEAVYQAGFEFWYAVAVLKWLITPANNERGPRYMEKALAAIHQANHRHRAIVFGFESAPQRVGLFVSFPDELEHLVCDPIAANYSQCSITTSEQASVASVATKTSPWLLEITSRSQLPVVA